MNKKLLLVPAVVALLLSSCGGGNTTSATPTTSEEPVSTTSVEQTSTTSEEEPSSSQVARYQVTFKDESGETLDTKTYDEGATPSYEYVKAESPEWVYTFEGWSLTLDGDVIELPAVSSDATYYAIISQIKRVYTITFNSNGGSEVASISGNYQDQIQKPDNPSMDGYSFVAWTYDKAGKNVVEWPLSLTENVTVYANWNEVIDIKAYLKALIDTVGHDPYSYIPDTMLPENDVVTKSAITYDFYDSVAVSEIKYGGFGEQWRMVIDNLRESERFYAILTLLEATINGSVAIFNTWLDNNPGTTASHEIGDTAYTARIEFKNNLLSYTLEYKTGFNIPFFGEFYPQIDMTYNITTLEKAVRIQLSENNAMRYIVTDDSYSFGLQYGVSTVSRKAYFQIDRDEDENVAGHVYEYVQYKDKDLIPSCADFYIGEEYTSVVGNKASGITGFKGYINELYETEEGKLLGYKVRETFSKWGFEKTYNTLWFNLNDIANINSIKAVKNSSVDPHENNHDIYLNGSASKFEPVKNKYLLVSTSRKYDVEMRKQYFYGFEGDELVEYETLLPMMFIQDDGTESGENNYSTFESDISSKNNINASVILANKYLEKIRADYLTLIDIFIENKDTVTSETISDYIGEAIQIEQQD